MHRAIQTSTIKSGRPEPGQLTTQRFAWPWAWFRFGSPALGYFQIMDFDAGITAGPFVIETSRREKMRKIVLGVAAVTVATIAMSGAADAAWVRGGFWGPRVFV